MMQQQCGDASDIIRHEVAAGILPTDAPVKVWAGYGTRKMCDACELSTPAKDIEYEVDMLDGRILRFHQQCLTLWHHERVYLQS
jgi:hypothetical protein